MFSDVYKTIERKYENRRTVANNNYMQAKKQAYSANPRLAEIDREIAMLGIKSSKAALTATSEDMLNLKETLESEIAKLKNEKDSILKSMHANLSIVYQCEKCHDTGYITTSTGTEMCTCLRQELINESYNTSNLFRLKNDTFEKFDLNLYSDEIDVTKYGLNISPKQNMEKIKKLSLDFIDNFENPDQKNLLFTGTPGLGKTFISGCIANEIINKGYNVLYQTSPLLLDMIFEYKYGNKGINSKELYDNLLNVNLLIIDDLGTENLTPAKFVELFTLLNSRLLNPKAKTIISTNLSLEDLAKTYDDRIISRIIGNYNILRFFGDDIRLKK